MSDMERLLYRQPAKDWSEVLPLGNGHLGAMVWGNAAQERISLNEGTLWSGYEHDQNNPSASAALTRVRELVFEGRYREAQTLLEKEMLGEYTESYLPLGDLYIDLPGTGKPTEYTRELRLADACAIVHYMCGDVYYRREQFISHPHRALILRLDASRPVLDVTFRLESPLHAAVTANETTLRMRGQCPEHVDPDYTHTPEPICWGERGKRFEAVLTLLDTDGETAAKGDTLRVTHASYAVLSLTAVYNPDLRPAYATLGYGGLLAAHRADYQALYGRVSLQLGEQPDTPTDERLRRLAAGAEDPALVALYFQYGRDLMISASRAGGQPITLQGLWNWQMQPPWSSNYTTNINTQMNYWPALNCGLKECLQPYFDFIARLCHNGQETAMLQFGCRGFTLSHNTDYWAVTHSVGVVHGQTEGVEDSGRYAWFPLGSVWICQELWRYYEYTGDETFLERTAFPLLREAALFCADFLLSHQGYEVICPSASPENAFFTPDGETASIAYACTMDMTLVREAFDHFEQACALLGREDELLAVIRDKRPKLYPYHVGQYGQLQEWCEDFDEPEPGHRHLSHLYGLFPAEQFCGQPELMEACRRSIDRRLAHGGGHTGWSCAWLINLFAVLGNGEAAYAQLKTLLVRSTYPNLWGGYSPFQIDANFGGIAGIANLLVQDRGGQVTLLPALPRAFANGEVKGLRIKGGKAVDIRWEDGRIREQRIYAVQDE